MGTLMTHLLQTYFAYMKDPAAGIQRLLTRRSFRQACLGYLVAALSWVLFFNVGDQLGIIALFFKIFFVFLAELTAGYFIAALCGLFLDLRRVKVSAAQLFVLIGSAGFLKILLVAFVLISAAFPMLHLKYLAPLAMLFVFVLQLVYLVRGLKHAWNVGAAEALGGWLFGFIPVIALFGLASVFFIWFLVLLF